MRSSQLSNGEIELFTSPRDWLKEIPQEKDIKRKPYAITLASLLLLMLFPILTIAEDNLPTASNSSHATGIDSTESRVEALPLIGPQETKEGNYLRRLWRFLFEEDDERKATRLKANALAPDTLVLGRIKRENVKQSFAVGNNGPTLTHFAVDLAQEQALSRLEETYLVQRRLEGATLSGRILDLGFAQTNLSAVYLQGQTTLGATSGVGIRNHAWSLGVDTWLFSEQLQLYSEYAWTRHNSGLWAATPAQDGGAYKLQLSYHSPDNATFLQAPLDWVVGVRRQQIGRLFQSPAEPTGERNIARVEGFTHLKWQGLRMNASVIQKVHHSRSYAQPSQYSRRAQLQGQYQFEQPQLPEWLGLTGLHLQLSRISSGAINSSFSQIHIGADFTHRAWDWKLRQTFSWRSDGAREGFYDRSRVTVVEAQLKPLKLFNNRLSLAPEFQYKYRSANLDSNEQWVMGFNTRAVLIPEKLQGQFRVNANQVWGSGGMKCTYSTSGNLNWQLTRRNPELPAIHLFLKGRYQAVWNQARRSSVAEDYLVLLGISFE